MRLSPARPDPAEPLLPPLLPPPLLARPPRRGAGERRDYRACAANVEPSAQGSTGRGEAQTSQRNARCHSSPRPGGGRRWRGRPAGTGSRAGGAVVPPRLASLRGAGGGAVPGMARAEGRRCPPAVESPPFCREARKAERKNRHSRRFAAPSPRCERGRSRRNCATCHLNARLQRGAPPRGDGPPGPARPPHHTKRRREKVRPDPRLPCAALGSERAAFCGEAEMVILLVL